MVGGNSCEQLLMIAAGAGVDQLADLGREILADARQLAELASSSRDTASPPRADRLGGGTVCADLEGVFAFDLEQVGDLAEDLRDRRGYPRASPCALDSIVEHPRAARGQRLGDRRRGAAGGP